MRILDIGNRVMHQKFVHLVFLEMASSMLGLFVITFLSCCDISFPAPFSTVNSKIALVPDIV